MTPHPILFIRQDQAGNDKFRHTFSSNLFAVSSLPLLSGDGILNYGDHRRFRYLAFVFDSHSHGDCRDIIVRLRSSGSRIPIIVQSDAEGRPYNVETLDWGADAYINRQFTAPEFISVLRAVLRGREYGHDDAREAVAGLYVPKLFAASTMAA